MSENLDNFAPMTDKSVRQDDFIFTDNLRECCRYDDAQYCWHVLCLAGSAHFSIGDNSYNVIAGDAVIKSAAKPVCDLSCSDDFRCEALLISWRFLNVNLPQTDYNIIGTFSMLDNPVLPMHRDDLERCRLNFMEIRRRLEQPYHSFYAQVMRRAVETMILDFYDIHARWTDQPVEGLSQPSRIMQRFVSLLQDGLYKKERSVEYYASRLFITAKYLSECCIIVSGHNASHWIDRYTTEEVARQLSDRHKPLTAIADELGFSSPSYLSRYVTRTLGCSPSEYRKRMK